MSRMVRFSSAALGMVLLAGLAFYQGRVEIPPGEEGVLSGTALAEPGEKPAGDCEIKTDRENQEIENCVEKDLAFDSN